VTEQAKLQSVSIYQVIDVVEVLALDRIRLVSNSLILCFLDFIAALEKIKSTIHVVAREKSNGQRVTASLAT
jgi:hypothetical protein